MTNFDQEVMARTSMGEARSLGYDAMIAVMWTGMNRFTSKKWYSDLTIAGVFLKYKQYSCWWPEKPDDQNYHYITNISSDIPLFGDALKWAGFVAAGGIPDPTTGATHYIDDSIEPPDWTKNATMVKKIGTLSFYKGVS